VETIVEGVTGVFFDSQEPRELMDAILEFESNDWDTSVLRAHAYKFGTHAFRKNFLQYLADIGRPVEGHSVIPFPEPAVVPERRPDFAAQPKPVSEKAG
jgi:hypothetical protein